MNLVNVTFMNYSDANSLSSFPKLRAIVELPYLFTSIWEMAGSSLKCYDIKRCFPLRMLTTLAIPLRPF